MAQLIEAPCATEGCNKTIKTYVPDQIKTCCVCNYKEQKKRQILKELGLLWMN